MTTASNSTSASSSSADSKQAAESEAYRRRMSEEAQERHRRRKLWRECRQRLAFWVGAIIVGLVGLLFARLADGAILVFHRMVDAHAWWPWVISPVVFGGLVWMTQGRLKNARGSGIQQVIAAIGRQNSSIRNGLLAIQIVVAKMAMTLTALLGGASVGREGPTVHIGAAIMYAFGRRLGLYGKKTVAGLILAGGAAGIAAAFNTPLAGVMFAIEELSQTFEQRFSGLVLTAVLMGGVVTFGLVGHYSYFGDLSVSLAFDGTWLGIFICALAGGLLGGFYAKLILPTDKGLIGKMNGVRSRHPVWFAVGCGLMLAALGLVSGQHIFGTGYDETRAILEGHPESDKLFLLWKFLANVVSYISGLPGGLFSPSLSVGAAIAPWITPWLPGASLQSIGLLGMAGYLAGVTRTPMTASVITIELSHSPDMLIPILATCLIASAVSSRLSPVPIYHALAQQLLNNLPPSSGKQRGKAAREASHSARRIKQQNTEQPDNKG